MSITIPTLYTDQGRWGERAFAMHAPVREGALHGLSDNLGVLFARAGRRGAAMRAAGGAAGSGEQLDDVVFPVILPDSTSSTTYQSTTPDNQPVRPLGLNVTLRIAYNGEIRVRWRFNGGAWSAYTTHSHSPPGLTSLDVAAPTAPAYGSEVEVEVDHRALTGGGTSTIGAVQMLMPPTRVRPLIERTSTIYTRVWYARVEPADKRHRITLETILEHGEAQYSLHQDGGGTLSASSGAITTRTRWVPTSPVLAVGWSGWLELELKATATKLARLISARWVELDADPSDL